MRLAIVVAVMMSLFGCNGTALVLEEDTEPVSELIDQSINAVRTFYANQGQQRLDFLIEFLAARPSCGVESPLLILATESRCLTNIEKVRLRECRSDAGAHTDCVNLLKVQSVSVSSQLTQSRQTTVTLIGVVASYQQVLSKVLQDKKLDTTTELNGLQSRLKELHNRVNELRGDNSSTDESSQELEKQIEVIGELVNLIRDADEKSTDFEKLKAVVLNKGPTIDLALEKLLTTYEKVDKPFSDLLARREIEHSRQVYNDLDPSQREQLSNKEREQRIRAIYEPEMKRLNLAASPDALAVGLQGMIKSHKKLQEGFKGDLTDDQRRRIAKENQDQLKAVFKTMFNIVKLFT